MKRFCLLFFLFIIGCSRHVVLTCSSVDYSNMYGSKSVVDSLVFDNDNFIFFERRISISVNEHKVFKNVYKGLKLDGKAFHKLVNGKYKISSDNNNIYLLLKTKNVQNLSYIGISDTDYDSLYNFYSSIGFSCK